MKNKIFNGNSIYQLLLFLLMTNKEERALFIVGDAFPEKVRKNLDNVIFVGNDMVRFDSKNKLKYLYNYIFQLMKLRKLYHSKLKHIENNEIYGATIFAPLLAKKNKVYVLEDGTGSYVKKEDLNSTFFLKIKKFLHSIFMSKDNFHIERKPYVSKVIYTGIGKIPDDVLPISQVIDIRELWNNKSLDEQNEILRIFNMFSITLDNFKNRTTVLFTQTLNEDGFVSSEKEKIAIYEKALQKENFQNVIIKPHPREKTNYENYFPGIVQIQGQIPFQLFTLLDIRFSKAITLFSTAALSLGDDVEIEWFGTTLSEALRRKYGEIPISKFR